MKKKRYTHPVSVVLSEEMFEMIRTITNLREISFSDFIREALEKELALDVAATGGNDHEKENI
jgi:predicted CopG family antitoxin